MSRRRTRPCRLRCSWRSRPHSSRSRCRRPQHRLRPAVRIARTTTYQTLLDCVTLEGVRAHQQALQDIADANGGTPRRRRRPGTTTSVDYVVGTAREGGLRRHARRASTSRRRAARFEQHTPVEATYETGGVHGQRYSATSPQASQPSTSTSCRRRASTSGCDGAFTKPGDRSCRPGRPDDFAGFPTGTSR